MSPVAGAGVWAAEVLLVSALAGTRAGARIGAGVAFLSLPFPAFVGGSPVFPFLLALGAAFCFLRALDLTQEGWRTSGWMERARHLVSLFDTRSAARRPPGVDSAAMARLAVAGLVFLAALALARGTASPAGWDRYPVRWAAGGVMAFAGFEALVGIVLVVAAATGLRPPLLHDRPHLARSLAEFWGRRWNRSVSAILRARCFEPLVRANATLALAAVFAASAAIHAYAAAVSLGAAAAACWAAFFLAQPVLLVLERRLGTRRWPAPAQRAWTAGALALVAPRFVEPFIRLFE